MRVDSLDLTRLPDAPTAEHAEARRFCLDTIKQFYGFDYRRDWHADLDSLLLSAPHNQYSRHHAGAFWTLRDEDGLVATAGVRHLGWKPNIVCMFPERYPVGEAIASLCRVYVREDRRGRGIGRRLVALSETEAARLGYKTMYLHASSDALSTIAFWRGAGYAFIGACETSAHFEKRL